MVDGTWWLYDAEGGFDRDTCLSLELHNDLVVAKRGAKGSYSIQGDTLSLFLPSFFHSKKLVRFRQELYHGKPLPSIDANTVKLIASGTHHDCLMLRKDGEWVDAETAVGRKNTLRNADPAEAANDS